MLKLTKLIEQKSIRKTSLVQKTERILLHTVYRKGYKIDCKLYTKCINIICIPSVQND